MKWAVELNRQGTYWWTAETPLGAIYAEFQEKKYPMGWCAYWHPYDKDHETPIGQFHHEEEAMAAAEKWIRAYARRESKRLARFDG